MVCQFLVLTCAALVYREDAEVDDIKVTFFKDTTHSGGISVPASIVGWRPAPDRLESRPLPDPSVDRPMFALLSCHSEKLQLELQSLVVPKVAKVTAANGTSLLKSVNIIHHEETKLVSLRAKVADIAPLSITYDLGEKCDDSMLGAPVFTETWHLAGMHVGGCVA